MQDRGLARGNLATGVPDAANAEVFETLVSNGVVRIERITSRGQASPAGFWYEQAQREFVLLVTGRAALEIDGSAQPIELSPGDWLDIPAHCRHRVLWTATDETTLWLAVHWG